MLKRAIQFISPATVPLMTRPSYYRELASSTTVPVMMSLAEAGVAGLLAATVFNASKFQIAAITAAGMFANLTSFGWARLARGRPKVKSIAAMMVAATACIGAVGLLPLNATGAWLFVGLVIAARCLWTGVITIRSTVWRHNYPRSMRGRITSRLAMIVSLMLLIGPTLASFALDRNAEAFRIIYPLAAAIALIGIWHFAQMRLRGERALLRFEQQKDVKPIRHGDAAGIYEYDERQPRRTTNMWTVLKRDPMFRRYMLWQFFGGVSNMMVEPVLIYMAAAETESLAGGFVIGMALTHGLPTLLMLITLPMWAKRLDSMHIVQFRIGQAWLWTASQIIIWIGAAFAGPAWATIALLALGRIVLGAARGGGALAWNLGHNDFASRELVAAYMGIHVTLTGVRGAFAPFLGMALFAGWAADSWLGQSIGGFSGMGGHVFAVSAILSGISMGGFWAMQRKLKTSDGATHTMD